MAPSLLRAGAAGALLAMALTPGASRAAPAAPSCRIVTDPAGDAQDLVGAETRGPNQPNVDITSVDVATDRQFLTTVVRVTALGSALGSAPHGATYFVYFRIGSTHYFTSAARFVDGTSFSLNGGRAPEGGSGQALPGAASGTTATGVFDEKAEEVRVSVPLSLLRKDGPVTPGRWITSVAAATYVTTGLHTVADTQVGTQADGTDAPGRYTIGARSCVRPGR